MAKKVRDNCMYGEIKGNKTYLKLIYLITSFHLQTKIHLLESVALDVNETICMEDH